MKALYVYLGIEIATDEDLIFAQIDTIVDKIAFKNILLIFYDMR